MSDVLQRIRSANPIADLDDIDSTEFEMALAAIEDRWKFGDESPRIPAAKRPGWMRPALVAAGSAVLVILAIAAPMIFLRGEEQSVTDTTVPAVTTTVQIVAPTLPVTTTLPTPTTAPVPVTLAPPMTWERVPHQAIFEDATIFQVVNGGPGLVAVGALGDWNVFGTANLADGGCQAVVFVSSDGYSWERIDSPAFVADRSTAIGRVVVGPDGTLVGRGWFGYEVAIFVSPDGVTWERIVPDGLHDDVGQLGNSVIATEAGFVAVGKVRRVGRAGNDAAVWLSADGREWTRIEDDALLATADDDWSVSMDGVTAGGPGLVAGGLAGIRGGNTTGGAAPGADRMAMWVSSDGTDWERLEDLEDSQFGAISGDPEGSRLIAFGTDMWISEDGYTWVRHGTQDPLNQPRDAANLAWDGDRVVAGGPDRVLSLWVSGDRGDAWSRIDPNDSAFDGYRPMITGLTGFGDLFVAVGEAGEYTQEVGAVWIGTLDG
jgi:hypothetical protein